MRGHLYDGWCEVKAKAVSNGGNLHLFAEIDGARAGVHEKIVQTVLSHYEDPKRLSDRIERLGFKKAAKVLQEFLPRTKKAQSGHMGEILATEVVPAVLPDFRVPIKRLRWLDGRESALRGEDIIGIARGMMRVRFLKGESKSRVSLTPSVVAEAREALGANDGRPSQHAMAFIMSRLLDMGETELALTFEEYMLAKSIANEDLVHLNFGLSGNDASASLQDDLEAYKGNIEQHAVCLQIKDHPEFIGSIYNK